MIIYDNDLLIAVIRVIINGLLLLPLLLAHAAGHAALSPILRHPVALFRILWRLAVVLRAPDLVPGNVPLLLMLLHLLRTFPLTLLAFHGVVR